nr:vegetative cell wall protein gp1-like [Aegilops tauschii subsp. strangulata]
MAAHPHLRRELRPRTSRLPPPRPPPYIQTPPRPAKVTGFGPKDAPDRQTAAYVPPRTTSELHRPALGRGKGEEGERTHPDRHTPVPVTGGPTSRRRLPSLQPTSPPDTPCVASPRQPAQLHARPPTHTRPPARKTPRSAADHQESSPGSPSALPAAAQPPEHLEPASPPTDLPLLRRCSPCRPRPSARVARPLIQPCPSDLAAPSPISESRARTNTWPPAEGEQRHRSSASARCTAVSPGTAPRSDPRRRPAPAPPEQEDDKAPL